MQKKWRQALALFTSSRMFIVVLILTITFIWGYGWVWMKVGLDYMGPFTFSAFRFTVGSLALLLLLWGLRRLTFHNLQWKPLLILGLIQTVLVFALIMYGMRFVEAGKSSIILYTMPIWSSLLASHFLNQKLGLRKVIGLILGIAGLFLILGVDLWKQQTPAVIWGESLILLAALCWAVANIYYQLKFSGQDRIQVNAYQMVFGAVGITILAVLAEWGQPIVLNVTSLFAVLFTGVLASALCFTIWFYLLNRIDTATATISTLLVPVFGVVFSWLFLGEPLTLEMVCGGCMIVLGISFSSLSKTKTTTKETVEQSY
ncbi:drug/metabolite transporter (DMT)-like permease [Caldalkalibacillus uzonensis]|uniref:Drug/metabolite transporter (DMT)-like permease n=1 Tax=Caldalkalibacillus uzonensis TaxID=353224 RepID=A0ABU0CUI5_9BACI|nr:DMT family transporter [Caldalkalibacillus uzonensis]MDQ0340076.1 drug/metabolite transporter (DMT)-like permease [Caldalkalibacillus uzonensis]